MPEDLVLLADDVFTNYFPDAKSKNVLVDASLLLNNDWHSIATDVWQTPKEIFDKLVSNNLTFDCFASLHKKYGDDIHLLFDCSTRDGDLAKVQNYFDDGIMDVDEKQADADIFETTENRMDLPAEAEPEESQKAPLHREEELEDDISNGRFSVWKDGIELWETSPVVGISYRNISAYAQKNLPDCYILNKEVALNTFHNLFVDVLVSQGLAGILILLGVLVAILRSSIRGCRRLKAGKLQTRDQAALLGAALLPIMIGALFLSDILYMNSPSSVLFWILLGSWCRMMREPEGENKYE